MLLYSRGKLADALAAGDLVEDLGFDPQRGAGTGHAGADARCEL